MNIPKIAIIDHVGKKAGLDHYDLSLAAALIKQHVDVNVYSNFESDKTWVHQQFSFSFSKGIFRLTLLLIKYWNAILKLKRNKTDWVVLHVFHFSIVDLLILRLVKFYGIKICLIAHDIESLVEKGSSHIEGCLKISDRIVVHNNFVAEILKGKMENLSLNKLAVIPHGNYIDIAEKVSSENAIKKLNLNPAVRYILFFGMIKKSKGLEVLIDSMLAIQKDIHLIVAGRVRDVSEKAIKSYSLRLGNRLHMMNRYISNEERNILFSMADVLVVPYYKVYQSGVLLMGMSYGLPVIASDIESNRLIVKYSNGLLFNSGDSADLATKLNELFTDDTRRGGLGKSGQEYVRKYHDWDEIGRDFKNIFSE